MFMQARVVEILQPKEFGKDEENKFKKQTVIFEEVSMVEYPNKLAIDFQNKNILLVESLEFGDLVDVYYSTKVSEKDGKVYNNIWAWKIEKIGEKVETMK